MAIKPPGVDAVMPQKAPQDLGQGPEFPVAALQDRVFQKIRLFFQFRKASPTAVQNIPFMVR